MQGQVAEVSSNHKHRREFTPCLLGPGKDRLLRHPATISIGVNSRHVSLAPFVSLSALGIWLWASGDGFECIGVRCAEASCVPTPELEFIADPKQLD